MKIENRLISLFLTLILLTSLYVNVYNFSYNKTLKYENQKHFHLSNGDPINITTPEDKIYIEPMSGYYPGTYGFENDLTGYDPAEWDVFEGAGYVNINDEMENHFKVVEIYDGSNTNHDELHKSFPIQSYGTVEFWIMSDDVSDTLSINLLDDTATSVWGSCIGWIQFYSDIIRYQDDMGTHDTSKTVYDNTWYHIKVEFECSTGNYHGLVQDSWRFYVDGELFGDFNFQNNIDNVSQIYFFTRGSDINYKYYIDAVGFSWDLNYQIGDNRYEGLLLSFNTAFNPDWLGYSLDGLANKTISGNVTIPLPSNGTHNIQVFGNDSFNNKYESTLRQFSIDTKFLEIITPENKTYLSPMSGYYPATLGFEHDLEGENPLNCIVEEIGGEINIVDNVDGHNKVVAVDDTSTSDFPYFYNAFDSPQTYGSYEFWARTTDATGFQGLRLYSGSIIDSNVLVDFVISNENFRYYDGAWHDITNCDDNKWYHIEISFECTTGGYRELNQYKFKVWINGTEYGQFSMWYNKSSADRVQFMGGNPEVQTLFIDAIGYSWDPNYNIGDNLNEGILLSFNSKFTLDWSGYSLDGLSNRTILGNTTLNVPMGKHQIQVFGNDTFGTMYQSDKRFFIISINNENKPSLSNARVTPTLGNQGTLFNFSVVYFDLDNNHPTNIHLIINSSENEMVKLYSSDNNYSDGVIYHCLTYLLPSTYNYTYFFNCSDGIYYNSTRIFNNLKVISTNLKKPSLINPQFNPGIGDNSTSFNFVILYYDEDNNFPLQVNITVNNITYNMVPSDPLDKIAVDGIEYRVNITLDFGFWNFQINCSDGLFTNSTGWIEGPEVSPLYNIDPIILLTPIYNSHFTSGFVNFSWTSVDLFIGPVNYSVQISNKSDFSEIIFEEHDIVEIPGVSSKILFINFSSNIYYWRIRPTYMLFNGTWSEISRFTTIINYNAPLLISSTFLPSSGTQYTIFHFTITYFDSDNNAPFYVKIIINGTSYFMEKQDPNDDEYTDGCIYQYYTLLKPSANSYHYSFECSDGNFLSATSVFIGPLVQFQIPQNGGQNDLSLEVLLNWIIIFSLGLGILIPFLILAERKIRKQKRLLKIR